ncbi:Hypothetical predicted protein [Pelobates cultripes]|uniref:Uncharacterized protein n=1 Tax=Pelobates cultripes TaxID=61616 RepID=A0AAD1SLM6_PELCU|nr:Hypothetical predicted protein [Pelobates cultripes]
MAAATRHPGFTAERTDLEYRRDKVLSEFWKKLEDRRHQTVPAQPHAHSPPRLIAPPRRTITAPAWKKAPRWRQNRRLLSLRHANRTYPESRQGLLRRLKIVTVPHDRREHRNGTAEGTIPHPQTTTRAGALHLSKDGESR